jgi:hypothetical protein
MNPATESAGVPETGGRGRFANWSVRASARLGKPERLSRS